jgi:hypothetical protein
MSGKHTKNGYHKFIKKYETRDKLEVIVDTCASARVVFEGINNLKEFVEERGNYKKFSLIVPLQIGTELKQLLFKDLLEKTLNEHPNGSFHQFYNLNKNIVRIVDTQDSDSYKYYFAEKAFDIVNNDPSFIGKICEEAVHFAQRYFPKNKEMQNVKTIRSEFNKFRNEFSKSNHDLQNELQSKEKDIRHFIDKHSNNPVLQQSIIDSAKEKLTAEYSRDFFGKCPDSYRLILQTLYSNNSVYHSLAQDGDFKRIRHDRGERAIESYLFNNRSNNDKNVASVVISNDSGARDSIQKLRRKTDNAVFVLSSYGFMWALTKLGIYDNEVEAMGSNEVMKIEKKRKKYATASKRYENFNDYDNPEIEEKWAKRFVEVILNGYWPDSRISQRER